MSQSASDTFPTWGKRTTDEASSKTSGTRGPWDLATHGVVGVQYQNLYGNVKESKERRILWTIEASK